MRHDLWRYGLWSLAALTTQTSATPLDWEGELIVSEPLEARNLENRASNSTSCPDSYKAENGMNFTTYCGQNNPSNDAYGPFTVNSMEMCMEYCSRYWGMNEGCYGVVFNDANQCWLRNSTTSSDDLKDEDGAHSALVAPRSQLDSYDTDCPFSDQSIQTLDSGESFTVQCDKTVNGYDTNWADFQKLQDPKNDPNGPFGNFWHTASLKECMQVCAESHPLCQAVSWSPDMKVGYANCWVRTGSSGALSSPSWNEGTMHSATLQNIDVASINKTCPGDTIRQSGKTFDVNCGQTSNQVANITTLHSKNITTCMDECVKSSAGCVAIVFDATLSAGYQNCYLQNATGITTSSPNTTYALLSGTSLPTSSSTGSVAPDSSSSSNKSSSKAWIAGPVIGGLAGIALIAGAAILWRRRKARKDQPPQYDHLAGQSPGANPYAQPPAEIGNSSRPIEMGSANYGYAMPNQKYAHEVSPPLHEAPANEVSPMSAKDEKNPFPPQELPT